MSRNETKREFTTRRRKLEKDSLRITYSELKRRGWKKVQNIFFLKTNDWFWALTVNTYLNVEKTILSLNTKPIEIDPLLWQILDIPENQNAPLSFRANGAFTCDLLPVAGLTIDDTNLSVESIGQETSRWLSENFDNYCDIVSRTNFSSQIKNHQNQRERGAYAITLVTTLISEGKLEEAMEFSRKYESGELESVFEMDSCGKSFHYHALQWLENNQATA